ncbi:pleckstrin homology-like domain family B member 2 [Elysia marginata]|uniref:Pleckstrin homology-like domain family B member 2 n=1 Tax=Elysia marginata TaxID=1093978 RepID=A0AAV4IFM6_9GAST|nr:pleckstrin homology-like domain family B member 2 [Elysia marginata]
MNPRVSPVTRPALSLSGKNGISRAITSSGSAIHSHLKDGDGPVSKNYDPGHLDIVSRPPSVSSTTSTKSNDAFHGKLAANTSKCPKPVIAVNSLSSSEVTYSEAEAIRVGVGGRDKTHIVSTAGQNGDTSNHYTERGHVQEMARSPSQSGSPPKDKLKEATPPQGNDFKPIHGKNASSKAPKDGENPKNSTKTLNNRHPAARSQSFHTDAVARHAANKVMRSRSLPREAVAPSSPQTNHHNGDDVFSLERSRSSVDKFSSCVVTSATTPGNYSPKTTGLVTSASSCSVSGASMLARPTLSSSSGVKRDAGHALSVRFADALPVDSEYTQGVEEQRAINNYVNTTASFLGNAPTTLSLDNIPGVDAAKKLCSSTISKKIYIDTVKKPALDRPSSSSPEAYHKHLTRNRIGHSKGQTPHSDDVTNNNFFSGAPRRVSPSATFCQQNGLQTPVESFYQQDTTMRGYGQQLFGHIDRLLVHDSAAEGADSSSPSTTISPSGSFGSSSPLRVLDQLSPKAGRNASYIVSPLALNNNSGCINQNNVTLNGSQWTLTPSSSLSSSSSLSKEATAGVTPMSSASPSSSQVSLQHPRRHRLPSAACPDEPPFSLMLMSSSSSSSLLLPASSSPSSSSTSLVPGLPSSSPYPTSSPTAAAAASSSSPFMPPGVAHKSRTSSGTSRPSSTCLRSDCLLPGGLDLRNISQLDYLLPPPSRHKYPPRIADTSKPSQSHHSPFSPDLSSPAPKPKLLSFNLPSCPTSPTVTSHHITAHCSSKPFSPLTSPYDPGSLSLRKNLLTTSASSSSDVGSSISSSATSLSSAKPLHHMTFQQTLLFPFPPGASPSSSPSLSSKTATDSRGSLASLIKKESIAASYQLEYCWFCGRPMPSFGTSLSGGEEHLEKLAELEKLLAQAQSEKVKLVEEQVRIRESEMLALQKNEVLERELQQVKLRERHTHMQARPMTRFLPNTSRDFDLRAHVEGAGHLLDACPHVIITTHSCRGWLHKMGGRIKTWKKRWFVFDRMKRKVFYFTDKSELKLKGSVCFQAIEEVYADHLKTVKSPSPKLTFCMKTFDRTYFLVAPSPETMTIWIDVLFSGAEGYQQFYDS